jgi:hypothetical protein
VAIPSGIHVAGQGEVHDAGTILLKFQARPFVDFRRFFPHPRCDRGRGTVVRAAGLADVPSKGFRVAAVWQFLVVGHRHGALARDELPTRLGGAAVDQPDRHLSSYFLLIFAV